MRLLAVQIGQAGVAAAGGTCCTLGCTIQGTVHLAALFYPAHNIALLMIMLMLPPSLLPLLTPLLAVWWHVIGCTTFVIMLPAVAPTHQTAEWVFTTFAPDQVYTGISSMPML
jgi:hypothetical protein